MYTANRYYLVDNISETIIGQFDAKSLSMANKMMDGFDFKKANLNPKDVSLLLDPNSRKFFETYEELMQSKFKEVNFEQKCLESDE